MWAHALHEMIERRGGSVASLTADAAGVAALHAALLAVHFDGASGVVHFDRKRISTPTEH